MLNRFKNRKLTHTSIGADHFHACSPNWRHSCHPSTRAFWTICRSLALLLLQGTLVKVRYSQAYRAPGTWAWVQPHPACVLSGSTYGFLENWYKGCVKLSLFPCNLVMEYNSIPVYTAVMLTCFRETKEWDKIRSHMQLCWSTRQSMFDCIFLLSI